MADFYAYFVAYYQAHQKLGSVVETARGRILSGTDFRTVRQETMIALQAVCDPGLPPSSSRIGRNDEEEFWAARDEFRKIRQIARSQLAAPWATFGCFMIRVGSRIPPSYVLPKVGGKMSPGRKGYGSLNDYIFGVGYSGAGKDLADETAEDGFYAGEEETDWTEYGDITLHGPEKLRIMRAEMSTGEGLVKCFVHRKTAQDLQKDPQAPEVVRHCDSVILTASEVEKVGALLSRGDSTLMSFLRQGWNGKTMGNDTSTPEYRLKTLSHTFRLGVFIGVQPGLGDILLNSKQSDGGTPQRFLWFRTTDIGRPDQEPDHPGVFEWAMPAWPEGHPFWENGCHVIRVCASFTAAVRAQRKAVLDGVKFGLDGHAVLLRGKTAAKLGFMCGHAEMTGEDWQLSDFVMRMSNQTRDDVLGHMLEVEAKKNRQQAEVFAERRVIVDDRVASKTYTMARANILRRLAAERERSPLAWVTGGTLQNMLSPRRREHQEPIMHDLVEGTREVEAEPTDSSGTPGMRYRMK